VSVGVFPTLFFIIVVPLPSRARSSLAHTLYALAQHHGIHDEIVFNSLTLAQFRLAVAGQLDHHPHVGN
jgi:hypothetical protein